MGSLWDGMGSDLHGMRWDGTEMTWDRDGMGLVFHGMRWDRIGMGAPSCEMGRKIFRGMGWDQISVGWELLVPCQARTGTGMGQDLRGMGAPILVPRSAYNDIFD